MNSDTRLETSKLCSRRKIAFAGRIAFLIAATSIAFPVSAWSQDAVTGQPGDKIIVKDQSGTKEAEAVVQLKGCCACVDELLLTLKGTAPRESKTVYDKLDGGEPPREKRAQYGHTFTVKIFYHYKKITKSGEPSGGELSIQWLEKMDPLNALYSSAGIEKDTWTDIPVALKKANIITGDEKTKGTFGPWYNRPKCGNEKNCPLPPAGRNLTDSYWPAILLEDKPAVYVGNERTLDFHIIVNSSKGCDCKHQSLEISAEQLLKGDPEHAYFCDPSGKPMNIHDERKGTEPPPAAGTGATPQTPHSCVLVSKK